MTFLDLAEKILTEEKQPLSAGEIWQLAVKKGYNKALNSQGKTPWATLGAQIYVNTKDHPKSPFSVTGERPKRFYLKSMPDIPSQKTEPVKPEEKKKANPVFLEKDLHAVLTYYAYYHLDCVTKTINHSVSNKKEFGEWVHPDMVGCSFPFENLKTVVFELSAVLGSPGVKLFSFELKRELSFTNLRESFFQAVSNSSWANEGYLVAGTVSEDTDFRDELSRLSRAFGIGIIRLNSGDPHSSEILLPAQPRDTLDWETINKLTMNPDFVEFISTVKIDITSRKVHKKEYDMVYELDSLLEKMKNQYSKTNKK